MALLFSAVVPSGQRLAQGGGCGMFWLQMNNLSQANMKITIEVLDSSDSLKPEIEPKIDYLPRGFL